MKYLIGLIVIVVIAAGAFFLIKSDTALAPEDGGETTSEGTSSTYPAPDNEGQPEMIVNEDSASGGEVDAIAITYTDGGFSPSSVTIKRGQTVVFSNASSREVWPASAVHPTHSVYPVKSSSDCLGSSFDACRGLTSGESWSFTFTAIGEWKYHNHLSPNHFGTVIVTE